MPQKLVLLSQQNEMGVKEHEVSESMLVQNGTGTFSQRRARRVTDSLNSTSIIYAQNTHNEDEKTSCRLRGYRGGEY